MTKSVIFFGNCQAESLANVYQKFLAPLYDQHAIYCDSQHIESDPIEQKTRLRNADIIVVQQFDFPSLVQADDLKAEVKLYGFPLVVAGFYWPYGRTPHVRNMPVPSLPSGPFWAEMGDSFLNRKIKSRVDPETAVAQYLTADVAKVANLDRVYEMYIERQRARDEQTGVNAADYIADHFRDEHVFISPAHPNLGLFRHVAGQVYRMMGVPAEQVREVLSRLEETPFPKDELAIHPAVIRHFGLRFADETTRYIYLNEGSYTFEEYALRYARYEWNQKLQDGIVAAAHEPGEAARLLQEALALSPASEPGWRTLSQVYLRLDRREEAVEAARTALQLAPTKEDAQLNLASVQHAIGAYEEAVHSARIAVEQHPLSGPAHRNLAVLLGREDLDEAVVVAERAAELMPGDPLVYPVLSDLFLRTNRPADAEAMLKRAAKLQIDDEALDHVRSELQLARGEYEGRIAQLQAQLQQSPECADLRLTLAGIYHRARRFEELERVLQPIVGVGQFHQEAYHLYADSLLLQGRAAEALPILEQVRAREPSNPRIYLTIGHAFVSLGEQRQAANYFSEAIRLDPNEPDYQRCLDMLATALVGEEII